MPQQTKAKRRRGQEPTKRLPGAAYKATKSEIMRRMAIIEEMMLSGRSADIVSFCYTTFKIGAPQCRRYQAAIRKRWTAHAEKLREKAMDQQIRRMERRIALAEKQKRPSLAFKAEREIGKLLGLYVEKHSIEGPITIVTRPEDSQV